MPTHSFDSHGQQRYRASMGRTIIVPLLLSACATTSGGKIALAPSSEGTWQLNDTEIHYVIAGKGDPIVVLHGGPGGNLRDMQALVPFAPNFRWVFYDQRGSGESARFPIDTDRLDEAAAHFAIEQHVRDLDAIREKLGVEKMTLLGHSWGGALATFYAAAHPDHLSKLIIYNGGPMWPELDAAKKTAFKARMDTELATQMKALGTRIGQNMEKWDQQTLDAEFVEMVSIVLPLFDCHPSPPPTAEELGRGGFWANQLTNRYIQTFERETLAEKLTKVEAPTLLTYGRCEPNPPERQTYLRDALPNATMVVFDESGHNAHREQSELFGQVLRAFLTQTPLPLPHFEGPADALTWQAARSD